MLLFAANDGPWCWGIVVLPAAIVAGVWAFLKAMLLIDRIAQRLSHPTVVVGLWTIEAVGPRLATRPLKARVREQLEHRLEQLQQRVPHDRWSCAHIEALLLPSPWKPRVKESPADVAKDILVG